MANSTHYGGASRRQSLAARLASWRTQRILAVVLGGWLSGCGGDGLLAVEAATPSVHVEGCDPGCDDGDPCTTDVCDADGRCVWLDACPDELPTQVVRWTGWYDCPWAQGKTSLELTTSRDATTHAMTAVFEFGPHPDNPNLAAGSWNMQGSYFPEDNSMQLLPTSWVVRAAGWTMVGMRGYYDRQMQQIHGAITLDSGEDNPFCDTFDLDRIMP